MKYAKEYKEKLRTPQEAVKVVQSGDYVQYNSYNGNPVTLDRALAARKEELEGVIIGTSVTLYPLYTISSDPEGKHFIYHNWHASGFDRKIAQAGNYYYVPALYYEMPLMMKKNKVIDVVMIQVGPMDERGYFTFGASAAHAKMIADNATTVVVEVNNNMPDVMGGSDEGIHISEVDVIAEGDHLPLFTIPQLEPSDAERKIAALLLEEIEDGACLQLGIGGLPNMVGELIAQSDLKDLGVHSEMLADAHMKMFLSGRVTGKRKVLDPGKMVYGFAMGSRELYEFIDDNPACATYPVWYVNVPHVIAQNPKMIAINGAIEVDLFSQINSESVGTRQISGTGGQVDFMLGSYMSTGGKGIICMTSTFTDRKGEMRSRIRPTLDPGTIVTVPRTIAHYIATEYGVVDLKGKSTWQRAEALISIAHPRYQDELVREAQRMNIWRKTNKIQN